jgi:hypothetical protein
MGDEILRRIAHGRGDVRAERPSTLYAAVVMAGGVPVEVPVQRPSAELVRAWMADEYGGCLTEGEDFWVIPAAFGGL